MTSALNDRCTCGHPDQDHLPGEGWRCSVCTCNGFDWDIEADEHTQQQRLRGSAIERAVRDAKDRSAGRLN